MTEKKIPERMCIACKNLKPKKELIRIVKESGGEVTLDFTGKKNGRGAYICPSGDCIGICVKKRLINKAFKCQIEADVYAKIQEDFESAKG